MMSEQTVKLRQNLSGLYDVTIEDKKGRIKTHNNLSFNVAIRMIEEELSRGVIDEKRD